CWKTLGRRWVWAGCFAGVAALLLFLQFAQTASAPAGQEGRAVSTQGLPAPRAAATAIAVLPFINMSGDPAQDILADGMSEEITAALARLPGLEVVGRSSAFRFKGEDRD